TRGALDAALQLADPCFLLGRDLIDDVLTPDKDESGAIPSDHSISQFMAQQVRADSGPDDDFIVTEHLTTVRVILPGGGEDGLLKVYEKMQEMSCRDFGWTDGNTLWRVVMFRSAVDDFKKMCSSEKTVRDFEHSKDGSAISSMGLYQASCSDVFVVPRRGPQHSPEASGTSPSSLNREEEHVGDPLHPIHVDSGDAAALAAQAAAEIHLDDQAGPGATDVEPPREVTPDFQLAEAVSHILSDRCTLDRVWQDVPKTAVHKEMQSFWVPSSCTSLRREPRLRFHGLACQSRRQRQMLIDRFGCTSPDTLDRIGHVYVAATSGGLEQGLAELEFRGYVAAVQEHEECDESGIKPELESFEAVPGKKTRGGQRKRPKRKADSMESSFHLSFEGKHPKAAVNMFLFRYTGRDVIKDEDFGTAAKRDPMASNAVCTSRHGEAEQSTSAKLANQVPRRRCPLQRSSCKILTMLRLQSTYRRQCGW
ncbi:unnamed protein product, partial [Symbiodinium sp. KB8]